MKLAKLLFCFCLALSAASCMQTDRYIAFSGYAQGGTYTVKLNLRGVSVPAENIRDHVDSLLADIDASLSGYNKSSILSRLNAGERVVPDSLFKEMYRISHEWYVRSEGAVDVAAGPLFDLWGFGFTTDSLPSEDEVERVRQSCGFKLLKSDLESALAGDGSLTAADLLNSPSDALPVLNFNAVAQGYSCDVVARYLHSLGVKDMLVDIGEIFCEGLNPYGRPWTIGVDSPFDGNDAPGEHLQSLHPCDTAAQGIVTSGNYRKFYVVDGRKYAHTIDPRSGYPVRHNLLSATVVAPDAASADAAATWCMVAGLEDAQSLLDRMGYEGCLIYEGESGMDMWCSDGFVSEPADSTEGAEE